MGLTVNAFATRVLGLEWVTARESPSLSAASSIDSGYYRRPCPCHIQHLTGVATVCVAKVDRDSTVYTPSRHSNHDTCLVLESSPGTKDSGIRKGPLLRGGLRHLPPYLPELSFPTCDSRPDQAFSPESVTGRVIPDQPPMWSFNFILLRRTRLHGEL